MDKSRTSVSQFTTASLERQSSRRAPPYEAIAAARAGLVMQMT